MRSGVMGGIIVVAMALALVPAAARFRASLGALVVAAFEPVVYSYILWRREVNG